MKRIIFFIVFFILYAHVSKSQTTHSIEWKEDIEYIKHELPEKHKDLFFKMSKQSFKSRLDLLAEQSGALSDFDVAVRIQQIIASVGDAHTTIDFTKLMDKKSVLPISVYWFDDGLYILGTPDANKEIIGCKILSINGYNISVITDSLKTLIVQDNEAMNKTSVPKLLSLTQLFDFFHFTTKDSGVSIEVIDAQGKTIKTTFLASEINSTMQKVARDVTPLSMQNLRSLFWDYYIPTDSIYYIQYNKCWSRELEASRRGDATPGPDASRLPSFTDFQQGILQTIAEKPVKKLIFDIRYNGGGSELQGDELIEKLSEIKKINQKGKLFVIIGRNTFSSAILNAMKFVESTNAILVGEETSGSPNHFGEVQKMQLPSSGLTISYSTKYFKTTNSDEHTIKPNIAVDYNYADYSSGVDTYYEAIKRY